MRASASQGWKNEFGVLVLSWFLVVFNASAQNIDNTASTKKLEEMNLEELINIQVDVGGAKVTNVFQSPSSVSVIDKDMIRRYNFQSIGEALNTIAGFSVLRSTSRHEIPTSRGILQDHYPNKVLFLINGIPNWNPVTGEMGPLDRISINDVERIEVLKGPASVVYGTNAFTGAFNVVLKSAEKPNTDEGEIAGTLSEKYGIGGGGYYSVNSNGFTYMISAHSYSERGDHRYIVGGDTPPTAGYFYDFKNYNNLTTSLKYQNHSILMNAYLEEEQKLGADPWFANGLGKPQNMMGFLFNYSANFSVNDEISIIGRATYDFQDRIYPRVQDISIVTEIAGQRAGASAHALYQMTHEFSVEGGVDYDYRTNVYNRNLNVIRDSVTSENNLFGRTIYEYSANAQIGYDANSISTIVGARYTSNEYFGNDLSVRGSAVFSIDKKNSVKAIVGQSYRAPSMFEVFYVSSTRGLSGLLDLKPEKSNSFELAYLTSFGKLFFQALGYYAEYKNKIARTDVPFAELPDGNIGIATTKQYANGKTFTATGFELDARYHTAAIDAFINFSYVKGDKGDSTTASSDGQVVYNFKYVPQTTFMAGASYTVGDFFVSGIGKYIDQTTGGKSRTIGAKMKLDVNVGYNQILASCILRHVLSATNLTDAEVQTAEYVDHAINDIPWYFGRRISYNVFIDF